MASAPAARPGRPARASRPCGSPMPRRRSTSARFALRASGSKRGIVARMSVGCEGRRLVDRPGEEPLAERAERDEPDAELLEGRDDLVLRRPRPEAVLALEGGQRLDGMGAADRRDGRLGHPEVADLALGDQVLDGARRRPRSARPGRRGAGTAGRCGPSGAGRGTPRPPRGCARAGCRTSSPVRAGSGRCGTRTSSRSRPGRGTGSRASPTSASLRYGPYDLRGVEEA